MTDAAAEDGPEVSVEEAPDDQLVVRISGNFTRDASTIHGTGLSLAAAVGLVGEDTRVLVPFVDCWIRGEFGPEDAEARHSIRLTLDNLAFVMERLTASLETDCVPWLCSMSLGEVRPIEERTVYMVDCLATAAESLTRSVEKLRELLPETPSS